MPCSPAKARLLLKEKKAVVKRRTPFTIQLTQATGETRQPVTLGVDAGAKFIGLSASTDKAEHYASEVELLRTWWTYCQRVGSCVVLAATARRATALPDSITVSIPRTKAGSPRALRTKSTPTCLV